MSSSFSKFTSVPDVLSIAVGRQGRDARILFFPCLLCFVDTRTPPRSARLLAVPAHIQPRTTSTAPLGEQPFLTAPLRFGFFFAVAADPVASEAVSAMDDHGSEPKLVF